ncbi:MAG: 4Fe-4S binding protein [Clostridiales bacterium]|nr:4Fe-4S binding protein [Clostridiales bacterium]
MSKIVANDVKWRDISPGGIICDAGNAALFKTGDWRSIRPRWIEEKCKQCSLCYPTCPDSSIIMTEEALMRGFDYDHCKGCGVCAKACPFGAIEMEEEA